ncbi:MAG: diaminopimelate epimerase [Pseudomonadales bacterium]|nr:diaminopimelate epimerase [Pseudomonadales bacterium]
MRLPFTKMHGLGNDFMVLDLISHPVSLSSEQIRQLADRQFGVGFDQLLLVEAPTQPDVDFNYRIFNCDGGEVEHCGNGARCFARFVLDKGLTARKEIRVRTRRGIIVLHVGEDDLVTVDMGTPDFTPASLPLRAQQADSYTRDLTLDGSLQQVRFFAVSVGNPHAVILVDDIETAPVQTVGPALGTHPDFPQGVNVGFMQIVDRSNIRLRVFERGAGETQACGTGACAAVVCAHAAGLVGQEVTAHLRGGDLNIHWEGKGSPIIMRGPATSVFEGVIEVDA